MIQVLLEESIDKIEDILTIGRKVIIIVMYVKWLIRKSWFYRCIFSIGYRERERHILFWLLRFQIQRKSFHDIDDDDRPISEEKTIYIKRKIVQYNITHATKINNLLHKEHVTNRSQTIRKTPTDCRISFFFRNISEVFMRKGSPTD